MVKSIPNRNTIEHFTKEIDEARFVRQYNSSHLLMKKLYLCFALMNLLLGVVPHSSSLVTMAVPMPHWHVTSDYFSQVRDNPVWITIRDIFFPPDMLAMRTAGPNWDHPKLYGSFVGSSSWRKAKMRKENLSLLPNGPVNAVIFVNDSAVMNQKDGHWTMTCSVTIIIMKPLHSMETATIPTFDMYISCAAVMIGVSS